MTIYAAAGGCGVGKKKLPSDQLLKSGVKGSIAGSFIVRSVSPSAALAGAVLTLEGDGLGVDGTITIGGVEAKVLERVGETLVRVVVPEGAPGLQGVVFKRGGDQSSLNFLRLASDGTGVGSADLSLICEGQYFYDVAGNRLAGQKSCQTELSDQSIEARHLSSMGCTSGAVLRWSGDKWECIIPAGSSLDALTGLTGDGSALGPGVANFSLAATGVSPGTYTKVTVDSKGRVTSGTTSLLASDLPSSLALSGSITAGTSLSASSITATGSISGASVVSSGGVSATGAITAGSLTSTGNISTSTGTISGASISSSGAITGASVTTTGNISTSAGTVAGAALTSSGNITAAGSVSGATLSSSGNISTATGTISGAALSSSGAVSGASLTSTGNISTATGTISGAVLTSSGAMTATGTVTGGTLVSNGNITAAGTVSGASFSSSGTIASSGTLSGGNISTTGDVTASGTVSGGGITSSGNVSGVGLVSSDYIKLGSPASPVCTSAENGRIWTEWAGARTVACLGGKVIQLGVAGQVIFAISTPVQGNFNSSSADRRCVEAARGKYGRVGALLAISASSNLVNLSGGVPLDVYNTQGTLVSSAGNFFTATHSAAILDENGAAPSVGLAWFGANSAGAGTGSICDDTGIAGTVFDSSSNAISGSVVDLATPNIWATGVTRTCDLTAHILCVTR